jgi:formylglycine-generating enzyme required for sulfatase activity
MPWPSTPPAAPTGVTAVEGNGRVTLAWNPSPGATAYSIYYGTEYGVTKVSDTRVTPVTSPWVLEGLTNRTAYFFVVTASNDWGESADSAQVAATPLAAKPLPAMVSIPAGTFQMGDNVRDTDAAAPYALPVHTVSVSAFSIDRYETTWELWKEVYDWAVDPARGDNVYAFDGPGWNGSARIGTNMPVTQVNWYDVAKWLNARRGGFAGRRYPWGDALDPSQANYDRGGSTSVGVYPANGYGLYDMAGNVWEWTWDWGSEMGTGLPDDRYGAYRWSPNPVTDPHGPESESGVFNYTTRVRRGGSYTYGSRYLRCFERMFRPQDYKGT